MVLDRRTDAVAAQSRRPAFLVTIDTEGDNLWARPRTITTRNAEYLPRFQALCERYRVKPTYLVTYEMAISAAFGEFAGDLLRRGAGEVGMHLHAWNSPPLVALTADDLVHQPYLIEYPEPVIREKVARLTGLLEDTFGVKMTSHRAGRWAFNELYARILVDSGYTVDCSVTPHVSWTRALGDPNGRGGADYSDVPEEAYFVDLEDIRRPGSSPLLEVPVTVVRARSSLLKRVPGSWRAHALTRKAASRLCPTTWLRPRRGNLAALLRLVRRAARRRAGYLEFMLHSSELMPGGSPTFRDEGEVERLYGDLEALFEAIGRTFEGATLADYRRGVSASRDPGGSAGAADPSAGRERPRCARAGGRR